MEAVWMGLKAERSLIVSNMDILVILTPVSLILGPIGLLGFLWKVRTGQYDDVKGAAERVLIEEDLEGNSTEYSSDNKG